MLNQEKYAKCRKAMACRAGEELVRERDSHEKGLK